LAVRDTCITVLLLLTTGCHASVQGEANASTNGQADAELDAEVQKERASAPPEGFAKPQTSAPADRPLLGARSDLSLASPEGGGQCSCLKVALGPASLGAFKWKAERPAVDDERQLVVALTSEGSGCANPKGSLGASYWGYRRQGNDIVVYVENAVAGRPLASGAIIPKPVGTGQVFVAPVAKGVPFGKALEGKGSCKVGNPGPPRTAPVGPDESGAPAPTDAAEEMLSGQ
jgi:hypothetical protein